MNQENNSLKQILKVRNEKLAQIREMGVEPFAYKFKQTHHSAEILGNFDMLENKEVAIAGRIMSLRKMGKAAFCHIADAQGRIQSYIARDELGTEAYSVFKKCDIGDWIGISGTVFKTKMGEISIKAKTAEILAKNMRPLPIVKEKDGQTFDAFADKEARYRQRYLDLIVNSDVKDIFKMRSRVIQLVREILLDADYLEVETPILQPIYGGANAKPFTTHYNVLGQDVYLRIATEIYLKKLIIGGFERVFEIGKNFRNEGMDRNHNPEFTVVEFYAAYQDYYDQMDFVEAMIQKIGAEIGKTETEFYGHKIDLSLPFARKSIFELLEEHTGEDFVGKSVDELYKFCEKRSLKIAPNLNWGQVFDKIFGEFVEPNLIAPTFVMDHPKAISPLAKIKRGSDGEIVERFELFIGGAEFANSFSELNDPIDQRERLEAQAKLRDFGDEEAQIVDEDFLQAVEYGMPPTSGVGIGLDRLVMLFTGQKSIREVLLFPHLKSVDNEQ